MAEIVFPLFVSAKYLALYVLTPLNVSLFLGLILIVVWKRYGAAFKTRLVRGPNWLHLSSFARTFEVLGVSGIVDSGQLVVYGLLIGLLAMTVTGMPAATLTWLLSPFGELLHKMLQRQLLTGEIPLFADFSFSFGLPIAFAFYTMEVHKLCHCLRFVT